MDQRHDDLLRLRIERKPQPGPDRGSWWLFALLLPLGMILAGLLGYGLADRGGMHDGARPPAASATPVPAQAASAPPSAGISANGYVVARLRAALSTDITGRIVELPVAEGDRVKAGDLIARLDTGPMEAARARAQAERVTARATLELAAREHERQTRLRELGAGSAAEHDIARTRHEEAQAQLEALAAALAEIEVRIGNATVRAPFDGVVVAKNAEVGEVVSAVGAAGPNARGSVATIVDYDSLEVQVELAQTALAGVAEGDRAHIYLDAYPLEPYAGRVRQIWPTADRQKATVELRVSFEHRDARVLPELGVRVVFSGQRIDER